MNKSILFVIGVFFASVSINPIYGQLHGGHNQAPPIDFGGMKVSVMSTVTPDDFTVEQSKSANLAIRFFDSETNTNIKSVTYRIQIFNNENLLANEYFFDEDGQLDIEIKPKSSCSETQLWKCTKYLGDKHPIAGAYYSTGENRPVIQGPVFDKGGLYNIKVDIVGATNPKTMTTSDIHFETYVTIPIQQSFLVQTANAQEFPVMIKSFSGDVTNFQFDKTLNKFSYQIPFDWSNLHSMTELKQNILVRKGLDSFKEGVNVDAYIDGQKLKSSSVIFDTISDKNSNIIRIAIPHDELNNINEKLGSDNISRKNIKFELVSSGMSEINSAELLFENGYRAQISWNSKYVPNEKIPFTFSFYDKSGNLAKDMLYAYSVSNASGKELWSNIGNNANTIGIVAHDGVNHETFSLPSDGTYSIKLILTGQGNTNYENFLSSKTNFVLVSDKQDQVNSVSIPSWIKNNAGWWSEGKIDDQSFVKAIQYLVEQGIIRV